MNRKYLISKNLPLLAVLMITFTGCASSDRHVSGVLLEISDKHVKLDLPTGSISSIGFKCELDACDSLKMFDVGDEVILRLGAENRKNTLLSIKKCISASEECRRVNEQEILSHQRREEESKKFIAKMEACQEAMESDLINDSRYIPKNIEDDNSDEIIKNYNEMTKNPLNKMCLQKVVNEHQSSVYESCVKHGCGENIGGGCSHITGYSVSSTVLKVAVEKCGI